MPGDLRWLRLLRHLSLIHILTTNPIPDDIPAFDTYLEAGDIVCVYENVDPRERDYTQDLYEDDSIAYIRVTAVSVPWACLLYTSLLESRSEAYQYIKNKSRHCAGIIFYRPALLHKFWFFS